MTPTEVFTILAQATLESSKARRFSELATSKKGQSKLLDTLAHQFELAVRPDSVVAAVPPNIRKSPCFLFHYRRGFGVAFPTFDDAYDDVATDDSWLIVSADGSVGMHRPESHWDAEQVIAARTAG